MYSRRDFIKLSGLTLGIVFSSSGFEIVKIFNISKRRFPVWVNISEQDDSATVFINKSEMGQGIYTGLTSVLADELEFPIEKIKVITPKPSEEFLDPRMRSMLTGGSTSTINMFIPLRKAGAIARYMLVEAGAKIMNVPKKECIAKRGKVIHKNTGKYITYSQAVKLAIKLPVPKKVKLKSKNEWIYIGKPIERIDTTDKINGKAIFGTDIYIKDFVYATVIKPTVWGSKLRYYTVKKPLAPEIISIFPISSGIAICGTDVEKVWEAKNNVNSTWTKSPISGMDHNQLLNKCIEKLDKKGFTAKKRGNIKNAQVKSFKKHSAIYTLPYLYHAPAEPLNCTVNIQKDKAQIWVPTQAQTSTLNVVKQLTGLSEDKIDVFTTFLGGGFGRKAATDFVKDAVEIAKKVKKPVKLFFFSRR